MANTVIQLKWSEVTSTPVSLNVAEPAYSNTSGKLFIGRTNGGPIAVGGSYYTGLIDAATNANTASAIVKRDASGMFSATAIYASLYGNANTASTWQTARLIGVSGDATGQVSVDGSANANIPLTLGSTGVSAGTYGGATQIPTFSVDAKGRLTSAANVAISSSFTVTGNTGSGTQSNGGTLTLQGGNTGITTTVTGAGGSETVIFNTDTTVARTNTSAVGTQIFNTDLSIPTNNVTIGGTLSVANINVSGNLTQYNANTLNVTDPIIYLAANNSGNVVDIGFVGHFVGTGHSGGPSMYQHTGFVRDYNDNKWKLFSNVTVEPTTTVVFDSTTYYDTIKVGGIDNTGGALSNVATANITSATIGTLTLTNALTVPNGGTGATSFGAGQIIVGNGTGALSALANTGTAGTYGSASYIPVITTDAYGRVSAVSNTQIAIDASQITSGTLPIVRGGTNNTSFTNNTLTYFNGTGIVSLANVSFTVTGSSASNNTITSVVADNYGRISGVTYTKITGLKVDQGGTGLSTITQNGITYGNGTGDIGVTSAAGTADQEVVFRLAGHRQAGPDTVVRRPGPARDRVDGAHLDNGVGTVVPLEVEFAVVCVDFTDCSGESQEIRNGCIVKRKIRILNKGWDGS